MEIDRRFPPFAATMRSAFLSLTLILLAIIEADAWPQKAAADDSPNPAVARARRLFEIADSNDAEARSKLTQALSDESWYVRGQAALALARTGDKSLAQILVPLLKDKSWFVRSAALEAIGTLGSPTTDRTQPSAASADAYFRARAAATAGALGDSGDVDQLIKSLADSDSLVRRAAAGALGQLKAPSAVDSLIAALKDDDESVRKSAAAALGRIADRRAAVAVQAAAKDAGIEQWEYAAALYRLGNRDHLESITAALASEYADIRQGALKELLEFADERSLPALLPLARSGAAKDSASIRFALAGGLVRFNSDNARTALINMLNDAEPAVRAASVTSLSQISKGKSEFSERALAAIVLVLRNETSPFVLAAINDAFSSFDRTRVTDVLLDSRTADGKLSPNIVRALTAAGVTTDTQASQLVTGDIAERIQAANRLARLGDIKAVVPLIDALTSAKELELKVKAAEALGELRDRRAVDALVAATTAPQPELRTAATMSLGLIGDHVAAEALFVAARDEQPAVRDAAIRSLSALGISLDKVSPDLSSSSWQVRAAAVATLARLGDRNAVPLIVSALRDSDSRVRTEAARTLGQFNDPTATDALIGTLSDQSGDVRVEAAFALGRLKNSRALVPLASLLNDRDPRVSLAAAESLGRMGDPRATRVLLDSLASADWRVRSRATQVLARVASEGSLDQAVGPLARALTDNDPVVRYYAAEALAGIGVKSVPSLIDILRANREADRDRAARVLWRIGGPAVDPLLAVLQERGSTAEMRAAAAHTLGLIGDARATKGLASLLKDDRYFVRHEAAIALGHVGAPVLELLLEMANSSTPSTREAAIEALGSSSSTRALDRVIEALSDQNANVRAAAVRALGESASERAAAPLMGVLRDETSTFRQQAAASLARLGTVAMPSLIRALKDPKPSVRQLVAQSLGEIGSKDAVQSLIELITTDQSGARPEAIEALGKIGDPAAIAPILSVLRSGSVAVRKRAVAALAKFRDPRALDAMTAALADQNEEVRQSAASGLGEIGNEHSIAQLERLADKDTSSDVRAAAAQAIERIRQEKARVKPDGLKLSRP